MASRTEQIDWLAAHATGNATPDSIRNYFKYQNDTFVQNYFDKAFTEFQAKSAELRRTIDSDPAVQAAWASANAQKAEAAQALRDYWWLKLCAHNFNGRSLANVQSNRDIVEGWAQGAAPTPAFLQSILDTNPKIGLAWVKYESPSDARQRSQEIDERTKQTLLAVCRRYNYAFNNANVSIVLQHFPEGCSQFELEQAIASSRIRLAGATWQEIEEHTQALINQHNSKWAKKSIAELKAHSGQERAEREAIFTRVTQEPSRPVGITPLPDVITAEKIKDASRETIALWRTRYGLESINARLQGLC